MNHRTKNWLTAYIVAALIFAVLDVVWILGVANPLYQSAIGGILADKTNFVAAVLFYVIFVAGMVHYGVRPNSPDATHPAAGHRGGAVRVLHLRHLGAHRARRPQGLHSTGGRDGHPLGAAACSLVTWLTSVILRRRLAKRAA